MGMFERLVLLTSLYRCKALALDEHAQNRMNVLDIKWLRKICSVRRVDQVGNVRVKERCGNEIMVEKAEEGALQWFIYMERMSKRTLTKRKMC